MSLHIEISGEMERREWQGVKALAMIMLGEISADAMIAGLPPEPIAPPAPPVAAAPVPPLPDGPTAVEPVAPPAPPVAAAPVSPVPASETLLTAAAEAAKAAVDAGAQIDARGFPWDARIHAGTKGIKQDKSWTYKRGVDKALIAAVEAELRAVMAAPVATVPAPPITDPAAAFSAPVPPPPSDGAAEAPPAPPVAPSPPAALAPDAPTGGEAGATPDNITEFARVMRVVVAKQNAGALTTELTTQIAVQLGLTSVRDLAKRPDLIPAFEALLP